MLHQFRTRWLAGGGALLLVLSMSGLVAAASLVSDTTTHTQDATQPAGDSTPAIVFTDLNGNGIDDTCETAATPDSVAAAAALGCCRSRRQRDDLRLRGRPKRLDRWRELQPRRVRQLGREDVDRHLRQGR